MSNLSIWRERISSCLCLELDDLSSPDFSICLVEYVYQQWIASSNLKETIWVSSFQSRFCAISISRGLLIFLPIDTAAQHSICLFFKSVQCVRAFDVLHGFPGVSPSSSPFLLHASFSPLSLKESSKMGFPPPTHMIHIHTGGRVFPEVKWRGWRGGWVGVQFNISSQNLTSTRILCWVVNLCLRRLRRETRHCVPVCDQLQKRPGEDQEGEG